MSQGSIEVLAHRTTNGGEATMIALAFPKDTTDESSVEAAAEFRQMLAKAGIATCEPITARDMISVTAYIDLTEPPELKVIDDVLHGATSGKFRVVLDSVFETSRFESAARKLI